MDAVNFESTDALDHVDFSFDDYDRELVTDDGLPLAERYRGMTPEEAFYHSLVDQRLGEL